MSICQRKCSRRGHFSDLKDFFQAKRPLQPSRSPDIGTVILDSRQAEHAGNERERYHRAFSLDDSEYEGATFSSTESDPAAIVEEKEFLKERESKLASLTPVQHRRFEQYKDGAKIADIARREGSAFNTVKESVEAAQKKLGKLL